MIGRDRCLWLLDEAGVSPQVLEHVQAVERLATEMVKRCPRADPEIVQAGALLHDVGRAFEHGPGHVPAGLAFLEEHGVDERVVDCVARHMGAGVEPEQAQAWGWPSDRSYVPERIEERIVAHADNLTFGTRYKQLDDVVDRLRSEGLEALVPRIRELHAGLAEDLGVDPDRIAGELDREPP